MKTLREIRLSAELFSIPIIFEFVSCHAKACGLRETRTREALRAVEEAVTSIICYGYHNDYGDVRLLCEEDVPGRLIITIEDFAGPFDILSGEAPGAPDAGSGEQRKASAAIMRKMADHITYERREGSNVLTFTIEEAR